MNGSLQDRLERLEKQRDRLRVGILAVFGFAFLLLVLGQAKPKEGALTVEKLVLVDKDGKIRASFAVSDDGSVGLDFKDIHGKTRLQLSVPDDQTARVALLNENEKARVVLSDHFVRNIVGGEERVDWRAYNSGLALYSRDGDPRAFPVASFGLSDDHPYFSFHRQVPSLVFRDEEGKKHWKVPPPSKTKE